ncbi:hypothetical protein Tco_0601051 [Tanacetum coccineum]
MDYKRTKEYLPRVHHTRQMDEELRESYRTFKKCLFHEGRIVTPSFISENNMLPFFQVAITTPRTTQAQLLRDLNKLYINDIRPDLKGWELFFKEKLFCSIDKRNKVKACTAYMLYYLTIGRKLNFTSMIIYRMEKVINKRKGLMPFSMLLTRLHSHVLTTNPQATVLIARFTFHEHVMNPLYISRNPSKEKEKKIASPLVISSSSSSSDDNEAPSFLEFYDELSDNEDLTKAQREKRGVGIKRLLEVTAAKVRVTAAKHNLVLLVI